MNKIIKSAGGSQAAIELRNVLRNQNVQRVSLDIYPENSFSRDGHSMEARILYNDFRGSHTLYANDLPSLIDEIRKVIGTI
jgi:hypothetical protein